MVATPGLELLQVPLPGGSVRVVLAPWQRLSDPAMAPGEGLTVAVIVAAHPSDKVYFISEVPPVVETPVTVAVVDVPDIVATDVDVLLQVPPEVPSVRLVVPPAQTTGEPEIPDGIVLTVRTALAVPHEVV